MSVSLDGAKAATHDAFRGVAGSFDATLRGFDALQREGASLQVNATVARHNLDEVEALLNLVLARRRGRLPRVCAGARRLRRRDRRRRPGCPRADGIFLRWLFDKSVELRDRLHIKATCAPQYYRIMREVSRAKGLTRPAHGHGMQAMTRGCLAGSAVCFISRTATFSPAAICPFASAMSGSRRLGTSGGIRGVRRRCAIRRGSKGKCGTCGYRVVCEGCRARAYAATGDFLSEDPDCFYEPAGNSAETDGLVLRLTNRHRRLSFILSEAKDLRHCEKAEIPR